MLAAGEIEIAVDELRWLLEGCRHLLEAHKLLGEIAFAEGDFETWRPFRVCLPVEPDAMAAPSEGTLPYAKPSNRAFHKRARGWSNPCSSCAR